METRRRAAIVAEDAAEERAAREAGQVPDAEARERERLGVACQSRALHRRGPGKPGRGWPEGEYNEALGMGRDAFPLRVLAPAREERATTDTDAGAHVNRLGSDRLSLRTRRQCGYMGIGFPSVRPGVAAYPVTTAGASGAQRGRRRGR